MIPSRIAYDLALMRYTRLLIRFKVTASDAQELTDSLSEVVQTALNQLRAEIVAERDAARRRFFEVHPSLHPERGHMPPASPTTK